MKRFYLAAGLIFTLYMKAKEKYTDFFRYDTSLTPNLTASLIVFRYHNERDRSSDACPLDEPVLYHNVPSFVVRQSKLAMKVGMRSAVGDSSP